MGEQIAVFLFRNEAGVLWPAGMARGKWVLRRGSVLVPAGVTPAQSDGGVAGAVAPRPAGGRIGAAGVGAAGVGAAGVGAAGVGAAAAMSLDEFHARVAAARGGR